MNKLWETLKSIWQIKELRQKIIFTLGLIIVYRFGAQVTLPGIDPTQLENLTKQATGNPLLDLLNQFTGGAFSQASVMALGVMPYISASIVVQLMGIAVPYIQKLQKQGESGRKKITQITRYLTIAITLIQGPGYLYNLHNILPRSAFLLPDSLFIPASIIILSTGTIFAMWLGEKITDKGIGNGISLLIMIGILARMPQAFLQELTNRVEQQTGGLMLMLFEVIVWLGVIALTVYLVKAYRPVPVQYARRTTGGGFEKNIFGSRQYIPLKLNAAGVMPIIFAQAIMFIPGMIVSFSDSEWAKAIQATLGNMFSPWYNVIFGIMVILFTYFYTAITVQTNQIAEDLKRNGGFIPGIKPGTQTAEYLDDILSKITLPGSIFLALIAILPIFVYYIFRMQVSWAMFYGGTSLLIMVGVAIDTIQQVEAYLLNRQYDQLMKSGRRRRF
ncbi:MAG: preprotein translocase subunit SecY [Chlorobi bacterium]|nr:preprotein translocase subunit SecY [Chlorobiota bacterium]